MRDSPSDSAHRLLPYVAELELEVDRLRKQVQLVYQETGYSLKKIQSIGEGASASAEAGPAALAEILQVSQHLDALLRDLSALPDYHPSDDQVIAIPLRTLVEQVFRWQQRLVDARQVELRLDLECESVEWFPARLRHIVDNLFSNALKYRDPAKTEAWVRLELTVSPKAYELRVSDNGLGLPQKQPSQVFRRNFRATPMRATGLGVGLPVVKLLVEQSGGTLTFDSVTGQGTRFVVVLPRYHLDDYLL